MWYVIIILSYINLDYTYVVLYEMSLKMFPSFCLIASPENNIASVELWLYRLAIDNYEFLPYASAQKLLTE